MIGVGLFADIIANEKPLYIKIDGKSHFPALRSMFFGTYDNNIFSHQDFQNAESLILALVPYSPYNQDIIKRYESYYQETVLPKMEEDGCSEETISEYLAYRDLMCDPITFLLDVFFKEDKTFFDDYSIFKKEFTWEWNDDGQMRYMHDELLSMSNDKDDGWWEEEGRPDKIETYNRGKKIYTDLYGDPVGQKIYEVGSAGLANAFGKAYTDTFPNILLNMET